MVISRKGWSRLLLTKGVLGLRRVLNDRVQVYAPHVKGLCLILCIVLSKHEYSL